MTAVSSETDAPPRTLAKVSVVVPVYNSAESLPELVTRLARVLQGLGRDWEIVLVDDASPDDSWTVLERLKDAHGRRLKIARLLKNGGQHNATLCGFSLATGGVVVTMDDDLQNPPEEVPKLVHAVDDGLDLVVGAYDSKKHGWIRNVPGALIDRVNRRMFRLPKEFQLTSFRAIRGVVVANVTKMGGAFPYVTSMLLAHAARYGNVSVRHDTRLHGRSNYTLRRSMALALNLLLNYSVLPVLAVGAVSLVSATFALAFGVYVAIQVLANGTTVAGWPSTILAISFFSAVIMMSLFILALHTFRLNQQLSHTRVSFTIGELRD